MSSTGLQFRTPADVRAIPNAQWERWVRELEAFPGNRFSADWACQKTLRTIIDATQRRVNVKPRGRVKTRPKYARKDPLDVLALAAFLYQRAARASSARQPA